MHSRACSGGRDDLVAVAREVDPAVCVLGLDEPALVRAGDVVVATHLVDVDRVAQPLYGRDLLGRRRPPERDAHRDSLTQPVVRRRSLTRPVHNV